jgi:DNA repair photolyase
MRIIYEPSGRAREYAELAVSLYRGCSHGCVYCFAPTSTRTERPDFLQPRARKNALRMLKADAEEMQAKGDTREVLMSFTTDPYQPIERSLGITRAAIKIFHEHDIHYTPLTKAGSHSTRDIDLMAERPDLCRYGATLVFCNEMDRAKWEPDAAPYQARIEALWYAKDHGIPTWTSCEPVVHPAQTLQIIRDTVGFVDEYRIGKFNHIEDPSTERFLKEIGYQYPTDAEWRKFVQDAKALLDQHGCRYIFKKDLQPYLGGTP